MTNNQLMAQHYVDIIGAELKKFDGGKLADQVYKDLAWNGLMGYYDSNGNVVWTTAFNQLSTTAKNRIQTNINNHKNTGSKLCK